MHNPRLFRGCRVAPDGEVAGLAPADAGAVATGTGGAERSRERAGNVCIGNDTRSLNM